MGLIKEYALIVFSQDGGLLERVGLFREGRLNREDAAFSSIDSNIYIKSIFNVFILFPGLPSQSSFVQGLSVHSKVCKVHLKITSVIDVNAA